MRVRMWMVGIVACLTAVSAEAASFGGTVTDISGAVLVGARVVVRGTATGRE